jgi:hypothetical protein
VAFKMSPWHFKMSLNLQLSKSARKLVSSVNFRRKIIEFQVGRLCVLPRYSD